MTDREDQDRITRMTERIRQAILAYKADRLPIDRLSWELKSAIAALEEVADGHWIEKVRTMRNNIEVINATHIEGRQRSLFPEQRRELLGVLGELLAALGDYE
jgi:hypothetical protein